MSETFPQDLISNSERYAIFFAKCPIPFGISRFSDGRYIEINKAFEVAFGRSREKILASTSLEIGVWNNLDERAKFTATLAREGTVRSFVIDSVRPDGTHYRCRMFSTLLSYDNNEYIFSCVVDIHDQLVAEEEARLHIQRFQQLYEHMRDGCTLVGKNGRFIQSNRAFYEMLGYTEDEIKQLTPRDITPTYWHERDIRIENEQVFVRGYSDLYEKEHRRKDGSVFPVELQCYLNLDAEGQPDGFWGLVRDTSERKAQQVNLNFLAYHDPLTQLPNRALFIDRLDHALKRAKRTILSPHQPETQSSQLQLALLFLDLDRFKNINDTMGHLIGDMLLQIVAKNIAHDLREADILARFGGDEFVILLDSPISLESTTSIVQRILSLFAEPFHVQDKDIYTTISIGVSLFPRDGLDASTLIKHADLAMFKAKEMGRNTYCFYEASLGSSVQERMLIETALRSAMSRGEFLLYYQPQIDLTTGRLAGMEALLRWQHPTRGFVPPSYFISIAEDIGLISKIGTWALTEACRQMARWRADGLEIPRIAVNLSVQQLNNKNLVSFVAQQLEVYQLSPQVLELEVTESLLMHRTEQTLAILHGLEGLGIQLAVDDFGTGYSSLAYLKTLPLHRLKIDYSFIQNIGRDSNDEAIIRAIIALANSLNLETVAEGVEREEQECFLRTEGCRVSQGFRYAPPLPAEEIFARFHKKKAASKPPVK